MRSKTTRVKKIKMKLNDLKIMVKKKEFMRAFLETISWITKQNLVWIKILYWLYIGSVQSLFILRLIQENNKKQTC